MVQRVSRAEVRVQGEVVGRIGRGLLVLLGAGAGDAAADVDYVVEKVVNLRIFEDDEGTPAAGGAGSKATRPMNRSLLDVGGELLAVSQFTLYGDARKGRRPSFIAALEPVAAEALYRRFLDGVRAAGVTNVAGGRFGAMMEVELVNWGPVTILIDSAKAF